MTTESRVPMQARICRWVAVVVAGFFVAAMGALLLAGLWLQSGAAPMRNADIAVVLAGSYDRTLYAADLYNKAIVHRVAISRPVAEPEQLHLIERGIPITVEEDVHKRILLSLGVPVTAIDFLPGRSRNTIDETTALSNYLASRELKAIVITSPYVVRRASLIFGSRFPQSQVQVVGTPYEEFDWRWWENPASARAVALELLKSLHFLALEMVGR